MQLYQEHSADKPVSAKRVFKSASASVTAIQILRGETLPEHHSPVKAWLLCVSGSVSYRSESKEDVRLKAGEFHEIMAGIKHSLRGLEDSQLVLVR